MVPYRIVRLERDAIECVAAVPPRATRFDSGEGFVEVVRHLGAASGVGGGVGGDDGLGWEGDSGDVAGGVVGFEGSVEGKGGY